MIWKDWRRNGISEGEMKRCDSIQGRMDLA